MVFVRTKVWTTPRLGSGVNQDQVYIVVRTRTWSPAGQGSGPKTLQHPNPFVPPSSLCFLLNNLFFLLNFFIRHTHAHSDRACRRAHVAWGNVEGEDKMGEEQRPLFSSVTKVNSVNMQHALLSRAHARSRLLAGAIAHTLLSLYIYYSCARARACLCAHQHSSRTRVIHTHPLIISIHLHEQCVHAQMKDEAACACRPRAVASTE